MSAKAVSTWSLHRTLGSFRSIDPVSADRAAGRTTSPTCGLPLLDLPAELHRRGFDAVQLVHFHVPTRDPGYLDELRSALAAASVTLDAVLVDDGDLVDPQDADTQEEWISGWLEDAARLGARRARVVAGKASPTPERICASGRRLARLASWHPEVRVVTENWLALTPDASSVHQLLEAADGSVGLLIDLANWKGEDRYRQLASIAPLAETSHAKCHFDTAGPDADDYRRTLQVLRDAGFSGPLALVYDGPDADEWAALEWEHGITRSVFG
jgi:sugar phosphate isomerase/epimerase